MPEPYPSIRGAYYRAEADRVAELAARSMPGHGRERFAQAEAEYRTLAAFYETLPAPTNELEPADFPGR
jgi:hypothetical protein